MNGWKEYEDFVSGMTSDVSSSTRTMCEHLTTLQSDHDEMNMALLLTSSLGLSAESGEFTEIVKKIVFQGKPLNEETRFHLQRELGDVIWYWMNACRSLRLNPTDVIQENMRKLHKRFPNKVFSIHDSENRDEHDL